jgi:NADH:ubiquinone oxidoreductase subunit B-like Fe-S oxidoreductase
MAIESAVGDNFFTTTVSEIANWVRKNSLSPLAFGMACCAIDAQ